MNVPSIYTHPLYAVEWDEENYDGPREPAGSTVAPEPGASVVASTIEGSDSLHTIMLDLDVPATLVPSSTPGHSHLYIDVPLEDGYVSASIERGHTALRLPGVKKMMGARL
jgi:hypothetical protein